MPELNNIYTTIDAKDRIIGAALLVFSKRGFDGATTREIAKEAGVSSALIHHYFKDKENLWDLVGERISEESVQAITSAMDDSLYGTTESVQQMVAAYLSYWQKHPQTLRFQLWRVLGAPKKERQARSKRLNELFVPVVKAAQDAGHIRQDVPAGLLMVTMGGLIQYFLHSKIEMDDALAVTNDPPLENQQILDFLWSLVSLK